MNSAMQTLVLNMVKAAGIEPEWLKQQITDVVNVAQSIDARLAKIDAQNAAIMRHLGIEELNNANNRHIGHSEGAAILGGSRHGSGNGGEQAAGGGE